MLAQSLLTPANLVVFSAGFVSFVHKEVSDSFPQQLADCNRRLSNLLTHWKTVVQAANSKVNYSATQSNIDEKWTVTNINYVNEVDEMIGMKLFCVVHRKVRK